MTLRNVHGTIADRAKPKSKRSAPPADRLLSHSGVYILCRRHTRYLITATARGRSISLAHIDIISVYHIYYIIIRFDVDYIIMWVHAHCFQNYSLETIYLTSEIYVLYITIIYYCCCCARVQCNNTYLN